MTNSPKRKSLPFQHNHWFSSINVYLWHCSVWSVSFVKTRASSLASYGIIRVVTRDFKTTRSLLVNHLQDMYYQVEWPIPDPCDLTKTRWLLEENSWGLATLPLSCTAVLQYCIAVQLILNLMFACMCLLICVKNFARFLRVASEQCTHLYIILYAL